MNKEMYMNKRNGDVLNSLTDHPFINQRVLAEDCRHSLGVVNRCLKELKNNGYLDEKFQPTEKAIKECGKTSPRRAIILVD